MPDAVHKRVSVDVNDDRCDVDEGIADLVIALNRKRRRTVASCEDQPGMEPGREAWVAFLSAYQAAKFADLVEGVVAEPNETEIAEADPDDPGVGAVGVIFAKSRIGDAVAAVKAG